MAEDASTSNNGGSEEPPADDPVSYVDFDFNSTYFSFAALRAAAHRLASENGFKVTHDPKSYFNKHDWAYEETKPFASADTDELIRRGYFLCSPKSEGRIKGKKCPFKLTHGWEKVGAPYVWRAATSCLQHNHPLPRNIDHLNGRQMVKYEGDLTPEENADIMEKCLCKMDVPNMQINLERNFPGRCFYAPMLHRIKKNHIDAQYGVDRTQLHVLIEHGEAIQRDGGIFVIDPSDDFSIDAMHCQTKLMRKYAFLYGNEDGFILSDGTHGITRQKVTFVFFVVVDCLMMSKIVAWSSVWSEQLDPILRGARKFFQDDDAVKVGEINGYFDPFVDNMVKIGTVDLDEEADVGNVEVAPSSVGNDEVAPSSVGNDEVGNVEVAPSSVGNDEIAPSSVGNDEVGNDEVAPSSVGNDEIAQSSVGNDEVGNDEVAPSSVGNDEVSPSSKRTVVFMSDEGPAFRLLAAKMGWKQLIDRYHIAKKIEETWQGLADPSAYQSEILAILDEPDLNVLTSTLLPAARAKYTSGSAKAFVDKLHNIAEQVCYAYTSQYFTAGHVATQRVEGINSSVKANGKLKIHLSDASYGEAVNRIMQVARESDRTSIKELKTCRQSGLMVGIKFQNELDNTALLALRLSVVETTEDPNKFIVKESANSTNFATVVRNATVSWNGIKFEGQMTCSCCFYKSTNRPCPCICRICQHVELNYRDPKISHPRFWIGFHPLWHVALSELCLGDYIDAPWTGLLAAPMPNKDSANKVDGGAAHVHTSILSARSTIYDAMGDLKEKNVAERTVLLNNTAKALVNVAAESAARTKLACAEMTELTNRLGAASLDSKTLCVRATALSSSRSRYERSMLKRSQSSHKWKSKAQKGPPAAAKTLRRKVPKKVRHCSVCRKLNAPQHISSTHIYGTKCPYFAKPRLDEMEEDDDEIKEDDDEMEEDDDGGDDDDVGKDGVDDDEGELVVNDLVLL